MKRANLKRNIILILNVMPQHVMPDHIKQLARDLRRKSTPAEKVLRERLRRKQFDNIKRYRQYPLCIGVNKQYKRYIADFRCSKLSLVIELDGGYHSTLEQKELDLFREEMIEGLGYQVIRFENEEVLHSIDGVMDKIKKITYN